MFGYQLYTECLLIWNLIINSMISKADSIRFSDIVGIHGENESVLKKMYILYENEMKWKYKLQWN